MQIIQVLHQQIRGSVRILLMQGRVKIQNYGKVTEVVPLQQNQIETTGNILFEQDEILHLYPYPFRIKRCKISEYLSQNKPSLSLRSDDYHPNKTPMKQF